MRVAYVTTDHPAAEHDDEREIALTAWLGAGIEGSPVNWLDPASTGRSFDAAVVRSPGTTSSAGTSSSPGPTGWSR